MINSNSIFKMNVLPFSNLIRLISICHCQIEKNHQIDGIRKNSGTKSESLYPFNSIYSYRTVIFILNI